MILSKISGTVNGKVFHFSFTFHTTAFHSLWNEKNGLHFSPCLFTGGGEQIFPGVMGAKGLFHRFHSPYYCF